MTEAMLTGSFFTNNCLECKVKKTPGGSICTLCQDLISKRYRSINMAMPIPPPMHIVIRPVVYPLRRI